MKNTGVVRKIDELGRIVIPKEIRKNLNIRSGEDVQIYIEEDKIILKKYQKILSIKENAQKYLNMISKLTSSEVYVTDREKIIVSTSNRFVDSGIDSKIVALINDRRQESGYTLNLGEEKISKYYFLCPIIVDADAIGAIILLSQKEIGDNDKVIVDFLNLLLSTELY